MNTDMFVHGSSFNGMIVLKVDKLKSDIDYLFIVKNIIKADLSSLLKNENQKLLVFPYENEIYSLTNWNNIFCVTPLTPLNVISTLTNIDKITKFLSTHIRLISPNVKVANIVRFKLFIYLQCDNLNINGFEKKGLVESTLLGDFIIKSNEFLFKFTFNDKFELTISTNNNLMYTDNSKNVNINSFIK